MRSSHSRSPIDHQSNSSKSQILINFRAFLIYIYVYVTAHLSVDSIEHTISVLFEGNILKILTTGPMCQSLGAGNEAEIITYRH
jgi:hypothetical protein